MGLACISCIIFISIVKEEIAYTDNILLKKFEKECMQKRPSPRVVDGDQSSVSELGYTG